MIIRVEKNERRSFTIVENVTIDDNRLTWEALGMLVWFLRKPNGWEIQLTNLVNTERAGKDKILRILSELEEAGYVTRDRVRLENGTLCTRTSIRETNDHGGKPAVDDGKTAVHGGLATVAKPALDNPPLLSTKRVSTKEVNNTYTFEFETFYAHYPRHEGKPMAFRAWKKKNLKPEDVPMLLVDVAKRYEFTEKQFIPHPATYLNNEKWHDEIVPHLNLSTQEARDRELMIQRDRELTLVYGEQDA